MRKQLFAYITIIITAAACSPYSFYVLKDNAIDGQDVTYSGTVISIDKDNDFVLEVDGKLLFVDADDIDLEPELGDKIIVSGTIDNDIDEGESPELDATKIAPAK